MYAKRAGALLLCALIAAGLFAGCGKNRPAQDVSLFDLKEAMLAATAFGDMAYVSSQDKDAETYLATVSDLDYGKVDAFSITYAKDGKGNADELVVIRVKDSADTPAALASLQTHLKTRQAIYAAYDPTQSKKIGAGIAFSQGNYAVLIVSDDNAAVKAAFEAGVK